MLQPSIKRSFVGLLTLGLFATVLIGACSKSSDTKYESAEEKGTPELTASVFPHKDGWKEISGHGKFVIDNDTTLCANACHGAALEGGSARGCKSCHSVYPHAPAETWQGLMGHGKFVNDAKSLSACTTSCHGIDLAGGYDPAKKKSCAKCHTSYPLKHKEGAWSAKDHGQFVISAASSTECSTMCHRPDAPAEYKLKVCADCHPSYPDKHKEADWKIAGHNEFMKSYGGVAGSDCTKCHGSDLKGGSAGIACATSKCHHTGASGKADWKTSTEHGAVALVSVSKCLACHGADLKGNAVIEGCNSCHHKNWVTSHGGKEWKEGSQHGTQSKQSISDCKFCHGDDLKGGMAKVSCFSKCHDLDDSTHGEGWENGASHGGTAKLDISKCMVCHDKGAISDCKTCHHDATSTWLANDHPPQALANSESCAVCHGAGLLTDGCEKCHGPGKSLHKEKTITIVGGGECSDCLEYGYDYYNDEDICVKWQSCADVSKNAQYYEPTVHGVEAKEANNFDKCKLCHGIELKGGISEKSCFSHTTTNACHDPKGAYPHANLQLWQDVVNKTSGDDLPKVNKPANWNYSTKSEKCMTACHGKNWEGGIVGNDLWAKNVEPHFCFYCHLAK